MDGYARLRRLGVGWELGVGGGGCDAEGMNESDIPVCVASQLADQKMPIVLRFCI